MSLSANRKVKPSLFIETFVNICIIEEYEYIKEKDVIKTIYSKSAIEKKFSLREKLKDILPEILGSPNPSQEPWSQRFIFLQEIRDQIIHTKQSNSAEKNSFLLTRNIFELIGTSKEIVKYYGSYVNSNIPGILTDYPWGLAMIMSYLLFWQKMNIRDI